MRTDKKLSKSLLLLGAAASVLSIPTVSYAQDAGTGDEIIAIGTRRVIQDSIALKRSNTQIVDGLSADEIGDIPALSIGEALENVTDKNTWGYSLISDAFEGRSGL